MSRPAVLLEAASEEDVEALVDLERRCHTHPWRAGSFREEMGDPARRRVVVLRTPHEPDESGRGIIGYYAYHVVADEMHLLNLVVAPEHRRLGLGGFLLARALEQGARRGAEGVYLEVRRSNRAAQALYERFGFHATAVRPDYYADPREDALVLGRRAGAGAPRPATAS